VRLRLLHRIDRGGPPGRPAAGRRLVGTSLELGGKNGCYVRADADLDRAVDRGRSGDVLLRRAAVHARRAAGRLHEEIADDFLARFVARDRGDADRAPI
jgi:succinate-semialdehyde dehydrogenase/glutarate-semialdehyde dehydrogenase